MSAGEFAPALTSGVEEYGPTPEDSMHRSLDTALAKPAPAECPGPDGDGIAAGVGGLAEVVGAVLDRHVGWQMHRGQMIDELCAAVAAHVAAARAEAETP